MKKLLSDYIFLSISFNTILLFIAILFLPTSGYSFESSLALYLRFDEGKGDVALDISGNNNEVDINKTVWTNDGKFGSALVFNNEPESYVRIKKSKSLVPDKQVTLEAWIFPTKVEGNNNIISNTESAGHNIRIETNKLKGYIHIDGAYAMPTGGPDIVPGKWYHTAVTYDGKVARLYLDGQLIGEDPREGKITESSQDIFIGSETDANQPNQTYAFFGTIDEVRIWKVARTQDEIQKGMEKPLMVSPEGHLATCWGKIKKR